MADVAGPIVKAAQESGLFNPSYFDQPNTPKFQRDPGIGMYPPPEPGTTDLQEPGMFCSNDGLVINWMGENFYKSCSERVTGGEHPADGASYCMKRVGHPNDHEDYAGNTKTQEEVFDYSGMELEEAVNQALGAASTCWDSLDGTGQFNSSRAAKIAVALYKRIREAGPIYA